MAKNAQAREQAEITVPLLAHNAIGVRIIGTRPLIFNRMAEKAKRELLLPRGRKNAVERAATLKHDPLQEYRASVYRTADNKAPTRLLLPAPAFKGAMAQAALDLPGTKKTEVGRLTWVEGTHISVYGIPQLLMSVVRSADMNKTPDIRTRAIVSEWCCEINIRYVLPKLSADVVARLITAAGLVCGVGDFRQEKGKGNYGQFRVCDPNDAEYKKIVKEGGRAQQDAALALPTFYDEDSAELFEWWNTETATREK